MQSVQIFVVVPAGAAEVVSSNIVGYQKLAIQPGYNLIGAGFVQVGSGDSFALKDVFQGTDVENATAGGDFLEGDLIQLFDAGEQTYTKEYYFFTSNGEYGEEYDEKWYDVADDSEPTEEALSVSDLGDATGFWYISRGNASATLTTAGEVSVAPVTVTIKPGFNCIVYPFPAEFDFTALDWATAGATAGGDFLEGDLIQIFDAAEQTYTKEYYFFTSNGEYGEEYDEKWYDVADDSEPTTEKIPAGSGFWYIHRGSNTFTITLPSPIVAE